MLEDRTHQILLAGIREFIGTGAPITSERLYEEHDFGIKPAMIRWELHDLTKQGFFYQNHPSGGRIPTDKAYRLFVDELLSEDEAPASRRSAWLDEEELLRTERRRLVRHLAEKLNTLCLWYEPESDVLYNSGLSDLMSQLDGLTREDMLMLIDDIENLWSRLNTFRARDARHMDGEVQVFIGRNPIMKSPHVALMMSYLGSDADSPCMVMAVGPKHRMNYPKSLNILRELHAAI